jgi:hypothetical protein
MSNERLHHRPVVVVLTIDHREKPTMVNVVLTSTRSNTMQPRFEWYSADDDDDADDDNAPDSDDPSIDYTELAFGTHWRDPPRVDVVRILNEERAYTMHCEGASQFRALVAYHVATTSIGACNSTSTAGCVVPRTAFYRALLDVRVERLFSPVLNVLVGVMLRFTDAQLVALNDAVRRVRVAAISPEITLHRCRARPFSNAEYAAHYVFVSQYAAADCVWSVLFDERAARAWRDDDALVASYFAALVDPRLEPVDVLRMPLCLWINTDRLRRKLCCQF